MNGQIRICIGSNYVTPSFLYVMNFVPEHYIAHPHGLPSHCISLKGCSTVQWGTSDSISSNFFIFNISILGHFIEKSFMLLALLIFMIIGTTRSPNFPTIIFSYKSFQSDFLSFEDLCILDSFYSKVLVKFLNLVLNLHEILDQD